MKLYEQVIILIAALNKVMLGIRINEINEFKYGLLEYIEKNSPSICNEINTSGNFKNSTKDEILKLAKSYLRSFDDK